MPILLRKGQIYLTQSLILSSRILTLQFVHTCLDTWRLPVSGVRCFAALSICGLLIPA